MNETDLRYSIDQIMFRGAAISGCQLPQTEFFAGYIAEELTVFINGFGYGQLTFDEIILAMRLNSTGNIRVASGAEMLSIPFFGSSFNVDYISKILSNYMILRKQLDVKLKNKIDGY